MDFTFLTEDQIWGDDALEVMKRYGTKAALTDLTVILGGWELGHTCTYWATSLDANGNVLCISYTGDERGFDQYRREVSSRPVLPLSEASKISPRNSQDINGIRIAEYGEYPQTVANVHTSKRLEKLLASKSLHPTGKKYTFDSVDLDDYDTSFRAISYQEYEMDGKRYIRIPARPANERNVLSTGERLEIKKPYWVEVQPIEWLMDRSGTMVAKKCLFAGIQFDTKDSYDGDFSKTSMKHYLDTYFAKEMEPIGLEASREKNISKISLLRAVVSPNVSKKIGVVNRKMSAEEKRKLLSSATKTLNNIKVKDITD